MEHVSTRSTFVSAGAGLAYMTDVSNRLQSALSDRYTIERELGRSGMAIVSFARDQKLGRAT